MRFFFKKTPHADECTARHVRIGDVVLSVGVCCWGNKHVYVLIAPIDARETFAYNVAAKTMRFLSSPQISKGNFEKEMSLQIQLLC